MLPYFQWTTIDLGALSIQVWGLFVSVGLLVALGLAYHRAPQLGLAKNNILDLGFWIFLAALIGSRFFYLLEDINYYWLHPLDILAVWQGGMSFSGGLFGALLAGIIFLRRRKLPFWPYAELIIFVLPLGLFIGRLGCFFIFDHPGLATDFLLGQEYSDGVVRHNHGLYLSLNGLFLFSLFLILNYWRPKKNLPSRYNYPFYAIVFALEYGALRLALDFWRILDQRFLGLTVSQYSAIALILLGFALILYRNFIARKRRG